MQDGIVTGDEVREHLNFIERVASGLGPGDEYMEAMLRNQKLLTQAIMSGGPVSGQSSLDPSKIDTNSIPKGLTGTAIETIESGAKGEALFDIGGSKIVTRVEAQGNIANNETVVVIDERNGVKPAPEAGQTFNLQASGNTGGGNQDYFVTEESVPVESVDETALNWGFQSDEIVVYGFDAPIYVAFKPQEEKNRLIPLDPDDEPFSITMTAPGMKFRKAKDSTSDTTIKVVALK